MNRATTTQGNRIGQLDTLRGVAALMVVLHHSIQAFAHSTEDVWTGLPGYLDVGRCGVVIFFMISGFVIVKAVPGNDLRAAAVFWKHRFFRLYPPFWVSIAAAVGLWALIGTSDCCAFAIPVTPAALVANITMFPLRFHQPMLIGIYWTLELEALFYILITILALTRQLRYETVSKVACLLFITAVAVAAMRVVNHGATDIGKDQLFLALLHMSLMFSGAAIRFHWDRQPTRETFLSRLPSALKLYYAMTVLFFGAVVVVKVRHGIDAHTFRVAATYLLAIAGFLGCLRYFHGSRIGLMLGNRSYGIYLLHLPIMGLISYAMSTVPGLNMGYLPFLVLEIGLTLLAADLLRRFVERPAIKLGHLNDRRRRSAEAAMLSSQAVFVDTPVASPLPTPALP